MNKAEFLRNKYNNVMDRISVIEAKIKGHINVIEDLQRSSQEMRSPETFKDIDLAAEFAAICENEALKISEEYEHHKASIEALTEELERLKELLERINAES